MRSVVVLGALVAFATSAVAQAPPPRELVPWAPKWKVGQWWVVDVYQRDTRDRLKSPDKAEGAEPVTPEELETDPLPGFPPLRDGVPLGYKPGNKFRFEVLRKEKVRYPDDDPGTAPEEFWVLGVKTLEGEPVRSAELWYAAADLTLAKVVLDPAGKKRTTALRGTAQLAVPASQELGFPLDWPDLAQAGQERVEIAIEGRPTVEQKVQKVNVEGQKVEGQQVRLAALDPPVAGAPRVARGRATAVWVPGEPFWNRFLSGEFVARLRETSPR